MRRECSAAPPGWTSDQNRARPDPRPSPGRPPPRRPIGAVIADIHRDLGILPSHPLWRDVQQAMCQFGGSLARLLCDILDRAFPLKPPPQAPAMQAALGPALAPPGTGPGPDLALDTAAFHRARQAYPRPASSHSVSLTVRTPSSVALRAFDPASTNHDEIGLLRHAVGDLRPQPLAIGSPNATHG